MAWNREKWNQFVSDNTKVPPTDAAAEEAAEEAKALAETYEENIDLDALGVARVKTMLEELAAVTPSEQGPPGDDGAVNPNAINGLTDVQKYRFVNTNPPVSQTQTIDNLITFGSGDLDGTTDVVIVRCSTFTVSQLRLYWTPNLIPGSPAATPVQIWPSTVLPGTLNSDGYLEIYVTENTDILNSLLRSGVWSAAMGNITTLSQGQNQMQWGDGTAIPGWMAIGGTISIQITSRSVVQFAPLPYGIMV